ncbi:MAG: hypothetical protein HXX08_14235 [Chloroflexi bacterium]|uniref:Uncharacterized protein n=1 Tax=Candidatus Chlorohelix allophototropha TaxID=3003348 RepID=A0A8T7M4K9_9CHLR|nr:hypothetical protein [Chloroflexota bacterium]WJW70329.1 hypothetical protein OZ401_005063 [Chloroflexota bacterium L227-S17]
MQTAGYSFIAVDKFNHAIVKIKVKMGVTVHKIAKRREAEKTSGYGMENLRVSFELLEKVQLEICVY